LIELDNLTGKVHLHTFQFVMPVVKDFFIFKASKNP